MAGGWLHIEKEEAEEENRRSSSPFPSEVLQHSVYKGACMNYWVKIGCKRKSRVLFLSSSWLYYWLKRQQKNNTGSRRFLYNTFKVTFDFLFPLLPTSSSLLVVFFSLPSDSVRVLSTQVERFRDSCTCLYPNFSLNPTR